MFGRDRLGDRLCELDFDLAEISAAERHDGTLASADNAGDDRHVVADHVVEIERRLRLVDQRRDVADIDRLMQVDKLAVLPQAVEKLAEILLHREAPRTVGCCPSRARLLRLALRGNISLLSSSDG